MQNTIDLKEDEYEDTDGMVYCKKCHTRRRTLDIIPMFNKRMPVPCECQLEKQKQEEELKRRIEKQRIVEKIKRTSLLGEKYKNVTFENTEKTDDNFLKIFNRCKKYCEVAEQVLDKGIGIYLFGNKGTGKSHLTACMANELMNNYYSALYTNFSEISKYIRGTFNKTSESEYDFLERLTNIDFLFIDDFGTELVTKNDQDLWLQEKVFEVINKRYNNNKPIIFTSNYSLRQLIEERGMADKTIDRINEMCTILKLSGNSYRKTVKEKREELF